MGSDRIFKRKVNPEEEDASEVSQEDGKIQFCNANNRSNRPYTYKDKAESEAQSVVMNSDAK
jgi:hypothetical protein